MWILLSSFSVMSLWNKSGEVGHLGQVVKNVFSKVKNNIRKRWFGQKLLGVVFGGNKRSATDEMVPHLRWYMFPKYQAEIEKLPQTAAAVKKKILSN